MSERGNSTIVVRTPAKVNLYLGILGRRNSGYHDIESVLVPVSLFDTIVMEKTDGPAEIFIDASSSVPVDSIINCSQDENLAMRAVSALKAETGYTGGVRMRLEKNIPIGGGLGGGSADAAGVLVGLNELWKTGVSRDRLTEIGGRLGCDVPALVKGGPVLMEGLGERVTNLPIAKGDSGLWWLVLVNPGFGVSTRDIYSRYSLSLTSVQIPIKHTISALKEGDEDLAVMGLFNSLQDTVFEKYPLIQIIAENLRKAGASGVLLSGSGASVFGMARDERHACEIRERVRQLPGCSVWSSVVRILPDGVMVAHGPLEARV